MIRSVFLVLLMSLAMKNGILFSMESGNTERSGRTGLNLKEATRIVIETTQEPNGYRVTTTILSNEDLFKDPETYGNKGSVFYTFEEFDRLSSEETSETAKKSDSNEYMSPKEFQQAFSEAMEKEFEEMIKKSSVHKPFMKSSENPEGVPEKLNKSPIVQVYDPRRKSEARDYGSLQFEGDSKNGLRVTPKK